MINTFLNLSANINDSMAFAVEKAIAVVILFGQKYKESGNCRKECEMADNLEKPMIFVKVQHDYKQEGWLNLVMGKALWIECSSVDMVDKVMPQILRRISTVSSIPVAIPEIAHTAEQPEQPKQSEQSSAPISKIDNNQLLTMMQDALKQLGELKAEIMQLKEMKSQVSEIREEIKKLNQ